MIDYLNLWKECGGGCHGPRVEYVTMPLANFTEFCQRVQEPLTADLAAEREAHERMWANWEATRLEYDQRLNMAEADVAKLREALEPFANMSSEVSQNWREHETHWPQCVEFEHPATVGDLRRARQLLVKIKAVTS